MTRAGRRINIKYRLILRLLLAWRILRVTPAANPHYGGFYISDSGWRTMARYRRANAAGACYFFTVVTERRQRILIEEDADFATRWRLIKSHVTRLCGPRYFRPEWLTARRASKCCGTIWQHRYWEHQIRDEADLRHHIDYLHFNPVKHGYVRQAADWPYSSIHRFIERGWIAEDWAGLE